MITDRDLHNPHYDITGFERSRALALGAIACDRTAIVTVLHQLRRQIAEAAKEAA